MIESFQCFVVAVRVLWLISGSGAVEMDGNRGHPGADGEDRRDEGRRGWAVGAAGDTNEPGEEDHSGDAGEPGQPTPAVAGEAAGQHETGRNEAQEADSADHEVQHAVPADRGGLGRTGGEALAGFGSEDSSSD